MFASELMELARKEPQKYEGKRYKVSEGSAMYNCATHLRYTECEIKGGRLQSGAFPMMTFSDTELEEIPRPVPFLEAAKAYDEGTDIMCKHDIFGEHTYHNTGSCGMKDQNGYPVSAGEILHGEWTIK